MSAADDIAYLIAYWTRTQGDLRGAQNAMASLVDAATTNSTVRAQFAASSIFETAMIVDQTRSDLAAVDVAQATGITAIFGNVENRPPRLIMLDGIYDVLAGGFFGTRPVDGITPYLHSVDVSAGAVVGTLKGDPRPEVRASMLKMLRDVAIPQYWASFFATERVFETLDAQLPVTTWNKFDSTADLADRKVLQSLSASANGRVQSDLAKNAMATLPQFPTGDGKLASTLPPPAKPWYKNGRMISAGVLGLLAGGAAYQNRR